MKRETREKTTQYLTYIADDGTEFDTEDKCKEYEKSVEAIISKRFHSIAKRYDSTNGTEYKALDYICNGEREDATYYIVTPRNESDVNMIIAYVENCGGDFAYAGDLCCNVSEILPGKTYIVTEVYELADVRTLDKQRKFIDKQLEIINSLIEPDAE